jgi:hypothetical protein
MYGPILTLNTLPTPTFPTLPHFWARGVEFDNNFWILVLHLHAGHVHPSHVVDRMRPLTLTGVAQMAAKLSKNSFFSSTHLFSYGVVLGQQVFALSSLVAFISRSDTDLF